MQTSITPKFSLVFHTNKLGLFTYAHLFYRKTYNIDPWPTIQSLPGKTRNPEPDFFHVIPISLTCILLNVDKCPNL